MWISLEAMVSGREAVIVKFVGENVAKFQGFIGLGWVDKVTARNVARLPCEAIETLFAFVLWQVAREESLS